MANKINFKFEPIYDAEGILYEEKEAWNIFGDFISKSKAFASANKKKTNCLRNWSISIFISMMSITFSLKFCLQ